MSDADGDDQAAGLPDYQAGFQAAFTQAPVGMALLATDGRFLRVNAALQDLLGYSEDELQTMAVAMIFQPDDADDEAAARQAALAAGPSVYNLELRYLPKHRGPGWVLLSTALVRDAGGQPAYFVAHLQDVTERREREEWFRYRALHDPLTGLPNRVLFDEGLARALASAHVRREMVAVLLLDLDGFKDFNDRLGHAAGDEILQTIARRLTVGLRLGETAARLGGDEFGLLLEGSHDPRAAVSVAERILEALRRPFAVGGRETAISASIGIAQGSGQVDGDVLLRAADVALYRAKAAGRNRYAIVDPEPPASASPVGL
jgi:diguanylate cyclase (GGDEF)-like protein/PAS domain S-box-containing protein